MDSLVAAAARALAAGDPLGALKRVALRDDPPALALRGLAMAQLGDYDRARALLRRAVRAFGPRERLARARCQAAEAEVALAARDLRTPTRTLEAIARSLEAQGDRANALHTRLIAVRRMLLSGKIDDAQGALAGLDLREASAALRAVAALASAEIALRLVRARDAELAFEQAGEAASTASIPALAAEIEAARRALTIPAARIIRAAAEREARLGEVEDLLASGELVIDACRRAVRGPGRAISLAGRPVLFALARALAEGWPGDVPRERLIGAAFGARTMNPSLRARLRVEIGRLRAALRPVALVRATPGGFGLTPTEARSVAVLAPPVEGEGGAVLALLGGGASWSTSALASALGASQRSVQRALRELEEAKAVGSVGRGRSQRWLAPPVTGFATTLLLPIAPPAG